MNWANKTDIPLVILNCIFLIPEHSESIDDDTKNDVQKHDVNDNEAGYIVDEPHEELLLVLLTVRLSNHHISNTSRWSRSLLNHKLNWAILRSYEWENGHEAVKDARTLIFPIFSKCWIPESVDQEVVAE